MKKTLIQDFKIGQRVWYLTTKRDKDWCRIIHIMPGMNWAQVEWENDGKVSAVDLSRAYISDEPNDVLKEML